MAAAACAAVILFTQVQLRALDQSRDMAQYIHDEWSALKGFPGGGVTSIAQTRDGYLWIGGTKGLVRFDGLQFQFVDLPSLTADTGPSVLGVLTGANGDVWVRQRGPSLFERHGGAFVNAFARAGVRPSIVTAICQGLDGAMLTASLAHGLLRHGEGNLVQLVSPSEMPYSTVTSLAQTTDGTIWIGTRDAGLFRVEGRDAVRTAISVPDPKVNSLVAGRHGELWVGTDGGLVEAARGRVSVVPLPRGVAALGMVEDHDGNLWVAAGAAGLFRVNTNGVSSLPRVEIRARRAVTAVFEDREGNLWIGSPTGIERLRDGAFTTFESPLELPADGPGALYADASGEAWAAGLEGGLLQLPATGPARRISGWSTRDAIYSIAGAGRDLWVGTRTSGLSHFEWDGHRAVRKQSFTVADGLASNTIYAVHRARDGAIWAGTLNAGVSRYFKGRFTTFTSDDGLASNSIATIDEDHTGRIWFGTAKGLSGLLDRTWSTLTVNDGLPSDEINCLFARGDDELWAGTAAGLALVRQAHVVPLTVPAALRGAVLGIAEDREGGLWVSTVARIVRVDATKLRAGTLASEDVRDFDIADGLATTEGVKRHRSIVISPQGKVWIATSGGVSMADPARLAAQAPRPLVAVDQVLIDGVAADLGSPLSFPSSRRRLAVSFVGVTLTVPERIRFRYRLDGFDAAWSKPLADRQAVYTNLVPGAYTFRVTVDAAGAVPNDDVRFSFRVEPTLWQTLWFRAGLLAVVAFCAWAAYRLRVMQVSQALNARFEERLAERTRIAQELHDTLLQGFVSASMQLHVAADSLPPEHPVVRKLSPVLNLMQRVIEEGRNAVRGLRSVAANDDLESAFARVPAEMGLSAAVAFHVIVEGHCRPLHPLVRDEVFRIGREALANAIRHAGATSIEVELDYGIRELRVSVRDNGAGIDEQVLVSGRDGHWGLSGMRERADRLGARLRLWSRPGAGTEVELLVPNQVAFAQNRSR